MISLPSVWVKANGILKGADIEVEVIHNQLVVSSQIQHVEKKATLEFKNKEQYLDRLLMGKYREGCNQVVIFFDDPEILGLVRETLRYLLGFEIVDQTNTSCTIRNISQGSSDQYDLMFRRMFSILLTMSEECKLFLETGEEKHRLLAMDLRETLLKLEQYCLRLLATEHAFSMEKKTQETLIIWNVAGLGKMWASFAAKPLAKGTTLNKKELQFVYESVLYTKDFYEVYFSRKTQLLVAMKEKLYLLRPVGAGLLDESKNRMIVYYMLRILNRIYEVSLTL